MIPSDEETPFVTSQSAVERPFYVLVEQPLLSSGEACLELCEGDIFLVTKYNRVGYWWGVSVYDLDRQGWFPSTFVQPYTGQVPDEAIELCETIKGNCAKSKLIDEPVNKAVEPTKAAQYNIVTDTPGKFKEYDSTVAVSKRGRVVQAADQCTESGPIDSDEDFDYDTWADEKNAARSATSHSESSKRRKPY